MNDSGQWQSPSAPPATKQGAQDYPPPPPALGTPTSAAAPTPAAQGWTPPPKPGLIPLRPLTLGIILGAAFKTMRHNPKATFGAAMIVQGGVSIVAIGVIALVSFLALSRIDNATSADRAEIAAGSVGAIVISAIVAIVLSFAGSAILQGVIVLDVMRASLGEKPKLGTLLRMAKGRIWALIGWTVLVAIAATVGVGVLLVAIVLLVVFGGAIGVVFAVLFGIFGALGALAVWLWLSAKLSLVPSVLMAERLRLRMAMKRSWSLTRNAFWKTLGIELLVWVIIYAATQVVTTPLSFLGSMLIGLADPNSQSLATMATGSLVLNLLVIVVAVLFGAIGSVIQSSTVALIYVDLRMRKEALDLDLARFVEARQAGATGLADPYLPPSGRTARSHGGAVPASTVPPQYAPPQHPAPQNSAPQYPAPQYPAPQYGPPQAPPAPGSAQHPSPPPPSPLPPSNESPWT